MALPLLGAAVGGLTHPLQHALHHYLHRHDSPEQQAHNQWKLRHSIGLGAAGGLGRAIAKHLRTLRHYKHATWRPPMAARLFVAPLVKAGHEYRLGAW